MTETAAPAHPTDTRARRNVAVLVAAQAILGAQMPLIFTIGGLAGTSLATNLCFATLPISLIVLGSMLSATPLSCVHAALWPPRRLCAGRLRRRARAARSAPTVCDRLLSGVPAGVAVTGLYMSAQGFYRFAAADTASDAFRPKAISYVMAGGLALGDHRAAAGQAVTGVTRPWWCPFLGTYLLRDRAERGGLAAVSDPRHPETAVPAEGRPARPDAHGAAGDPAHRRGDHLRHGLLRADEPRDDLDAAGRGGLRVRPERTRPTSSRRMCWRCSRRPSSPAT
jgi:hypothetical protein